MALSLCARRPSISTFTDLKTAFDPVDFAGHLSLKVELEKIYRTFFNRYNNQRKPTGACDRIWLRFTKLYGVCCGLLFFWPCLPKFITESLVSCSWKDTGISISSERNQCHSENAIEVVLTCEDPSTLQTSFVCLPLFDMSFAPSNCKCQCRIRLAWSRTLFLQDEN